MIDGKQIKIRQVSNTPRAWLCLQGTILSFGERSQSHELTMDIPIELISISQEKGSRGTTLIAALLSLLAGLLLGTSAWRFCDESGAPEYLSAICMLTFIAAGALLFLVLLVRFFIRHTMISLYIAPNNHAIAFWLEEKQAEEIGALTDEIEARKASVAETMDNPMTFAIGERVDHPWQRMLGQIVLCSLPALWTKIPWLLALCAIPIGSRLFSMLRWLQGPKEFRKAARLFLKREYAQAQDMMQRLIDNSPDYMPAKLFLIELFMRQEDFSGAEAVLGKIQDGLETETLQSIQQDIIIRKRIAERKKSTAIA